MNDDFMVAIRYIFVISLILVIVAYFAGSTQVLSTLGSTTNTLIQTATGRNSQGQFASYPVAAGS